MKPQSMLGPSNIDRQSAAFLLSAFTFRMGLAFVTFEQVRPFGMMLSDYCFFLSILFILPSVRSRLWKVNGSSVLLAGALILSGALFSLLNDADWSGAAIALTKLFILYGLFAPLAVLHSQFIRKNMLYLIAGISLNCVITVLQAMAFPGIVKALSINPMTPDESAFLRYQGLTQYPVTLGLSASLAILIAIGLMLFERSTYMRWSLGLIVLICADAALLSGSRTFLAALIPGLIVLAFLLKQRRRIVVRALVIILVVVTGLTYLLPGAISQFSTRLEDVGLVDYSRLMLADQAVANIAQKPILGWGVGHFAEAGAMVIPGTDVVQPVHVTILQYWYGAGLLGAIGFLALFIIPLRHARQVLGKNLPNNSKNAVRLILASYVSFFIIFSLGPYVYNRYLYIPAFAFAGFTACLLSSARQPRVVRPGPSEPVELTLGPRQIRQTPGAG